MYMYIIEEMTLCLHGVDGPSLERYILTLAVMGDH